MLFKKKKIMKKNSIFALLLTFCLCALSFGQTPIITAIVDGDCSGGNPKLLEIYAKGTVDFTLYSIESQINSNTSWSAKKDLSSFGTVTNSFVYVSTSGSATGLTSDFPSVTSVLETSTLNVNGDDRIRIIITADNTVIDQFGAENTNGSGETWEYTDSYAKRKDGTGPDAGFKEANWEFGGAGFLNNLGVCQNGTNTFETLIGGVGTYSATASTNPTINVVNAVNGLDYFEGNGPSIEKSFLVEGANLTANVSVNAPTNFEISLTSGNSFTSTLSLTPNNGIVNSVAVYVRLKAGLSTNTYTEEATISTTGATNKTVTLSGEISPAEPQFSYTSSFSDFNYLINTGGPSTEQTFTIEAMFLTSNLVISAPSNYQVSLSSEAGFSNSVSLTPVSGTISPTSVYVRLQAGLSVGNYSGEITLSSAEATTQTIAINGTVFDAASNSLMITGVFDGPLTDGTPKGIELYVLKDIADLSEYGVSSVTNGGGSNGANIEFSFPTGTATEGSFIYIASENDGFTSFFGFSPTYTSGALVINGDDAIELYENGQIIDVFGDVNTDGTGEVWDYLDGWAYRKSNNAPEGTTFTPTNWTYSGTNAFDGQTANASAVTPFPIATYTNATASVNSNTFANFSIYPNPITSSSFTISTNTSNKKEVIIFNILGKKTLSTTFYSNKKKIDISSMNPGVYIFKITETGKTTTKKLVIK